MKKQHALSIYKTLLSFYPSSYRRRFSEQMTIVFQDTLEEVEKKNGTIPLTFWFSHLFDLTQSLFSEHFDILFRFGLRRYLREVWHFNNYALVGLILMLPFFSAFSLSLITVLFTESQRALQPVYTSIFWQFPLLPIWVLGFPALAVLINLIPLFQAVGKRKGSLLSINLLSDHLATWTIILLGAGILFFIRMHDAVPCFMNHVLAHGLTNIGQTITTCRNG